MGVDHGLGGRDNAKSREKRAKRLAKKAAKAKFEAKSVGKSKKREVIFNEESRLEYLTGFRQRKKDRRQYGLAMQVIKDRKAAKERKIKLHNLDLDATEVADDEVDNKEHSKGEIETEAQKKALFSDDLTTSMFGGQVEVAIDTSIAEQIDEASFLSSSISSKDTSSGRTKNKPVLTQFDRAMKKAKHIMHVKAVNKRARPKHKGAMEGETEGPGGMGRRGGKRGKAGARQEKRGRSVSGANGRGGR